MKASSKLIAVLMACLFMIPTSVMAEESKPLAQETGSITINYYDDSEKEVPVEGSTWMLFKVGNVTTYTDKANPNVDALKVESLIPDFEFKGNGHEEPTTPEEVLEFIDYTKVHESELNIKPQLKDKTDLDYWKGTTNKEGEIVFDDLPYGVYLGVETKASRYHTLSSPFLISIPYTRDDENKVAKSQIDLVVEPKAIMAGDLKITKKIHGNDASDKETFSMITELPSGTYRYETDRGGKGTFDKKGTIGIKANETITIFDIPTGFDYKVSEAEANQRGYRTWYDNNEGKIKTKTSVEVIVNNERHKNVPTGTGSTLLLSGGIFVASCVAGIVLLKKSKREDNE